METFYIVDFATHNSETDAYNFKQAKKFTDLASAKKEFHGILNTYIQYGKLDYVCVIIWDCYGNKIMSEYWQAPEEEPEESEE